MSGYCLIHGPSVEPDRCRYCEGLPYPPILGAGTGANVDVPQQELPRRPAESDDWRSDEEAQALIDAIDRDPAPPEPKATAERAYEPDAQILDNLAWNIRQGNVVAANGTMGATATALERVAKKLRASARDAHKDESRERAWQDDAGRDDAKRHAEVRAALNDKDTP